jgi:hypothetical protein
VDLKIGVLIAFMRRDGEHGEMTSLIATMYILSLPIDRLRDNSDNADWEA